MTNTMPSKSAQEVRLDSLVLKAVYINLFRIANTPALPL